MLSLETALKLLELAEGVPSMLRAIYNSAAPLLNGASQQQLETAYDAAYARAKAMHEELQAAAIQPE